MKYYKGTIHLSTMGKKCLKCDLCGKECLGLHVREDKVRVCYSCFDEDKNVEYLDDIR